MSDDNGQEPTHAEHVSSELAAGLLEAMSGAVEPIRDSLTNLEAAIAEREQELGELRKMRTTANRLLGILDPEHDAESKPGPKPKSDKRVPKSRVSDETIDTLTAWLREHVGADFDVMTYTLVNHPEWRNLLSGSTVSYTLPLLAERGVVRLDRLDKAPGVKNGKPARVYRLVPALEAAAVER